MYFRRPKFFDDWMEIRREGGLKLLFQKKGWQVIVFIVFFYLIRDTLLYIVIPYIGYSSIKGCF